MTSDPSASSERPFDTAPAPTKPQPTPGAAGHVTHAAAVWSARIGGFLILILLLVFILQNTAYATVHFFGWEWNLPIGVGVLLAAVCGGLLTVAAGTVRIVQLRRAAKRNLKAGL